ncbi:hypothetical protein HQ524_04580 [Candidatus Uhrbacteria bacterium]|nr:hypothetical protein [Candidatus Uhrbacteria bacterium]
MNINDILLGGGVGVLIALLLALPALFAEMNRKAHKGGSHIVLPDVHSFLGRKLQDREVLALGLLIHLLAGLGYGVFFPLTVQLGFWVQIEAYSALSHIVFALCAWATLGFVVFPALGFGIMGYKEDKWMWFEVFVTTAIMAILFAITINWFQPSWFLV